MTQALCHTPARPITGLKELLSACPRLEKLRVVGPIPQLECLHGSLKHFGRTFGFTPAYLQLPNLQDIEFIGVTTLEEICLDAPRLNRIALYGTTALKRCHARSPVLRRVILEGAAHGLESFTALPEALSRGCTVDCPDARTRCSLLRAMIVSAHGFTAEPWTVMFIDTASIELTRQLGRLAAMPARFNVLTVGENVYQVMTAGSAAARHRDGDLPCHVTSLTALDAGFRSSPTLKALELHHCSVQSVSSAVPGLAFLRSLTLSCCSLGDISGHGAFLFVDAVHGRIHDLRTISLRECALRMPGIATLVAELGTRRQLEVIDLSGNSLGEDGARSLAASLHLMPRLTELRLADAALGDAGVMALANSVTLCKPRLPLVVINLTDSGIGSGALASLATSLATALPALKELYIAGNAIAGEGLGALAGSLHSAVSAGHVPTLSTLDISRNPCIRGVEPAVKLGAVLRSLLSLEKLDLSGCPLGEDAMYALAEPLRFMKCLTHLNLSNCSLGTGGARAFAAAIPGIGKLEVLRLSDNDIGESGAVALAQAFHSLVRLVQCDIDHNPLGDVGAAALLSAGLSRCVLLTALNVRACGISASGASAEALVAVISSAVSLRSLDASENTLGGPSTAAICDALRHVPSLLTLSLAGCALGDTGLRALAAVFRRGALPSLVSLDLARNSISDASAPALCDALLRGTPALAVLRIGDNAFTNATSGAIAGIARLSPALCELETGGCRFGPAGCATILEAAAKAPLLRRLGLDMCNIGYEGARSLRNALKGVKSGLITSLSFCDAALGDKGALKLAKALAAGALPRLTELSLSGSGLGDLGTCGIADALRAGGAPELTGLALARNCIGEVGARSLGAALSTIRWLRLFDLSSNAIGDAGATAVADGLRALTLLQTFSVSKCGFGDTGAAAIFTALGHAPLLKSFNVSSNSLGDTALSAFELSRPLLVRHAPRSLRKRRVFACPGCHAPP